MLVYDSTEERRQWLRDNPFYDKETKDEYLLLSDEEFDDWYFSIYDEYWQ